MSLTDEQLEVIVGAVMAGTEGITEEQLVEFVDWCNKAMIDNALVELILEEKIVVEYDANQEWRFFSKKEYEESKRLREN